MSGTLEGGRQAAATNKAKYGADFYKNIGIIGADTYKQRLAEGIAKPRGFALDRERAAKAGALGGTRSKRTKK
jgi:general stress protein YciG